MHKKNESESTKEKKKNCFINLFLSEHGSCMHEFITKEEQTNFLICYALDFCETNPNLYSVYFV